MKRIGRPPVAPSIRFWRFVQKTETCWLWLGKVHRGNYGYFNDNCGGIYAHRFAYEEAYGPIPTGLTLDHLCRTRNCVRPDHLEAVTQRTNILRGVGHAARNVHKTHCPAGHPLSGENLYKPPNGDRVCRSCTRAAQRRYYARTTHARALPLMLKP